VADRLLVTTLALHVDHHLAPGKDEKVAANVGAILARPCFETLTRVAINVKDRDKKHQPKTASAVAACLLALDSDAAVLDNGRVGDLVASARIWTGRHNEKYDEPKPPMASYVIVPHDPARSLDLLDAFVVLVTALDAVAGFVAVDPDFPRAHTAALSTRPRPEQVRDFPRRARERKGHDWYPKQIHAEISGPDWAMVLGPDHLRRIVPDPAVFPIIRDAGRCKVVALSTDAEDALAEAFDARLEAARAALAPILMDVSKVPVG
jgi:hypothetical protein